MPSNAQDFCLQAPGSTRDAPFRGPQQDGGRAGFYSETLEWGGHHAYRPLSPKGMARKAPAEPCLGSGSRVLRPSQPQFPQLRSWLAREGHTQCGCSLTIMMVIETLGVTSAQPPHLWPVFRITSSSLSLFCFSSLLR